MLRVHARRLSSRERGASSDDPLILHRARAEARLTQRGHRVARIPQRVEVEVGAAQLARLVSRALERGRVRARSHLGLQRAQSLGLLRLLLARQRSGVRQRWRGREESGALRLQTMSLAGELVGSCCRRRRCRHYSCCCCYCC